jgi:hypothetical protein
MLGPLAAPWRALEGLLLGHEPIAVPMLVEDAPGPQPRERTGGQVPGQPGGLYRQACALVIAADHAPDCRPDRAEDAQLTAVHTKTPAERTATIADTVHHSILLFH